MPVTQSGAEGNVESPEHGQGEQEHDSSEQYVERRSLVQQFLHSELHLCKLQWHSSRLQLLSKSSFYLELEPRQVLVRDQDHTIDILQLLEPWQLQRMRKLGERQTVMQLTLLSHLLQQLERGRKELSSHLETCDMSTFLCQWELVTQRMSKLSEYMKQLISLQTPGKVHLEHPLVLPWEAERRGLVLPQLSLSLSTKQPLIFDKKQCCAQGSQVSLQWVDEEQEASCRRYELCVRLLPSGSPAEAGSSSSQLLTSKQHVVKQLEPGKGYEFTVSREATQLLVYQKWHDSIVLHTQPEAGPQEDRSTSALQGSRDNRSAPGLPEED